MPLYNVQHDSFMCMKWNDACVCVTWRCPMCELTYSCTISLCYLCDMPLYNVQHDSFMCMIWNDACVCDLTLSYVRTDIFLHNIIVSSVWHGSILCAAWLIHSCDMTLPRVWHESIVLRHDTFMCVTWLFHIWCVFIYSCAHCYRIFALAIFSYTLLLRCPKKEKIIRVSHMNTNINASRMLLNIHAQTLTEFRSNQVFMQTASAVSNNRKIIYVCHICTRISV